jgi:glutamate carboxypeptidase
MVVDPRRYLAALETAQPELLGMLERVVNIDSGSYHAPGVNEVEDVIGATLAAMGFSVTRHKLAGRGDQFEARLALGGSGRRLLILGHADTVWPAGTVGDWPFARSGDRITGPGVGDMKGGVVMATFALRALVAEQALAGLSEIVFLLVPDEELGSPQSRRWIEEVARAADLCLTLEPSRPGGGVVTRRGAVGAVYLEARGITAHCGSALEKGASAVAALAPLVAELEALTRLGDGSSATVGIFRGGAARQVVPDMAEIHLDLRAPDDAAAESLLAAVRRIAAKQPADRRVEIALRGGFTRPAFPRLPGTVALFELAETLCAAIDAPIFEAASRGGSDGSFAAGLGVPTLDGLGPTAHDACSRRETVEVSSIAQRGALFAGLIASLAAGHEIPRGR